MAFLDRIRRRKSNPFQEIEEYRDLLEVPKEFEEGFNSKTILGALFVSVIMVPGNIYLELMVGHSVGAAAQWVTIILFLELAKRSFTVLKKQELYLLYYVTSALVARETGMFEGLLWQQYYVQSPAAKQFGISHLIPRWWAPPPDSPALIDRTFLHKDWLWPISLLVLGMIMGRIQWFTASYVLFRITSDYERLPFPFAPINAQGAMALAEESSGQYGWRWRVFSIGAVIGVVFGSVYVAVPAITGAFMEQPLQLIPIPWVDFTQYTGYFLPATPLGFTLHLSPIFAGLLAPFWAVVGAFIGVAIHTAAGPILYHSGYMPNWYMGMDTIMTHFVTGIDFWMSFGIGITFAIAMIGFYQVWTGVRTARVEQKEKGSWTPPPGRGDFRIWICIVLFCLASLYTIVLAKILFPDLVSTVLLGFFFIFAFVYTPLISFVNARLDGLVGQNVNIPYIRQATIFLSGFRGIEIWFVPFPLDNWGSEAERFRQIELTGTRFTGILKAELFMVPLILVTSFMYWSYIWKLAPIPSSSYPYVQMMWPLRALQNSVWYTATMQGEVESDPSSGTVSFQPSNLPDGNWWYWRARASADVHIDDHEQRTYGPWSRIGYLYTNFKSPDRPLVPPLPVDRSEPDISEALRLGLPSAPVLRSPDNESHADNPNPILVAFAARDPDGRELVYQFEVDQVPSFDGSFLQSSDDEPILFEAIKPVVIAIGLVVGLVSFVVLSVFGLPVLLIFGYIRSLTNIPHIMITEIIGALLARYYFWKRFGRQQWRLYAAVLYVGFSVGMSLVGMASVSIAMIQKAVSVLLF
ncbi:MAG: hypothetical protein J4F39_01080 [Candidatus Latescibacteria bacterium]|nr:hypothetical protein [Candidatus Latescibacterota bacterium]